MLGDIDDGGRKGDPPVPEWPWGCDAEGAPGRAIGGLPGRGAPGMVIMEGGNAAPGVGDGRLGAMGVASGGAGRPSAGAGLVPAVLAEIPGAGGRAIPGESGALACVCAGLAG